MSSCQQSVSVILVLVLLHCCAFAAVRGDKAAYVGGTITELTEGQQGELNLDDRNELHFVHEKGQFTLPYKRITSLEFGQKVGRRVGSTIALGVTTLGLMAIPMLLSKKKKHYLTVGFVNEQGGREVAIFELAKGVVRTTLPVFEARTGLKVESTDTAEASHAPKGKAAESAAAVSPTSSTQPAAAPSQAASASPTPNQSAEPATAASVPQAAEPSVYVHKDLTTYHRKGCPYLPYGARAAPLSEGKKGRTPCKVCEPPE